LEEAAAIGATGQRGAFVAAVTSRLLDDTFAALARHSSESFQSLLEAVNAAHAVAEMSLEWPLVPQVAAILDDMMVELFDSFHSSAVARADELMGF
jgi:hypothetical protein